MNTTATPSTEVDLWKFFESRASELKESMFKMVTWIIGFAAVLLGFAVKEGFEKGLASVAHPRLLMSVGVVGIVIVGHAVIVVVDYAKHLNRTFARSTAARERGSLAEIFAAGDGAKLTIRLLPPSCRDLLGVLALFALGFVLLIVLGLGTSSR
jgi:hypothetical protein